MHSRSMLLCTMLLLTFRSFALENPHAILPPPLPQSAAAEEQQPAPPQTDAEDAPAEEPESVDELKGKIDSFGEGFTELKNVVDVLGRMKFSGYIQGQYVHDDRSRS